MSFNASVLSATHNHVGGVDAKNMTGTHTKVHTSLRKSVDIDTCDTFEVLTVHSNKPLKSIIIQNCVIDCNLIALINQVASPQIGPLRYMYKFPWKVEHSGVCGRAGTVEVEPIHYTENLEIAVTIKYNSLPPISRFDIITNGKRAFTTHTHTYEGKQIDNKIVFTLQNYSRTNGLFVHGINLEKVSKIELIMNGSNKIDVSAPFLEEVVKKYNNTTIYLPMNGRKDPRPDDFQSSVHLGCIDQLSLVVVFRDIRDVVDEVTVQSIDLVYFKFNQVPEPQNHPSFNPKKRSKLT